MSQVAVIFGVLVGSWLFCMIGFFRMICKIEELQAENFALRHRAEIDHTGKGRA